MVVSGHALYSSVNLMSGGVAHYCVYMYMYWVMWVLCIHIYHFAIELGQILSHKRWWPTYSSTVLAMWWGATLTCPHKNSNLLSLIVTQTHPPICRYLLSSLKVYLDDILPTQVRVRLGWCWGLSRAGHCCCCCCCSSVRHQTQYRPDPIVLPSIACIGGKLCHNLVGRGMGSLKIKANTIKCSIASLLRSKFTFIVSSLSRGQSSFHLWSTHKLSCFIINIIVKLKHNKKSLRPPEGRLVLHNCILQVGYKLARNSIPTSTRQSYPLS